MTKKMLISNFSSFINQFSTMLGPLQHTGLLQFTSSFQKALSVPEPGACGHWAIYLKLSSVSIPYMFFLGFPQGSSQDNWILTITVSLVVSHHSFQSFYHVGLPDAATFNFCMLWWPSIIKLFLLLLYNYCNFTTVINSNVNIFVFSWS